jgi:hypothetical protein
VRADMKKPDPIKKRINDLKYQKKNKEQIKLSRNKWRLDNYEKDLFMQIRKRCKRENIPFNLELSDISIPSHCPYLHTKLTKIGGQGRVWTNPSLDRINPSLGYTKGNVEIISMKANLMKAHATKEELISFAISILDMYDNPG